MNNQTSIRYEVSIAKDGNQWCALLGPDLQKGVGGFGNTPSEALIDLGNALEKKTNGFQEIITI